MTARVLVAGVGNIFLGDDGFGVAVAQRLAGMEFPDQVEVRDFGIRSVHLAYQLLDGYDLVVLVDAMHRDGPPGTMYVLEPETGPGRPAPEQVLLPDAHDLTPEAVLAMVPALGGQLGRVVVVGCEPETTAEHLGLSAVAEAAVDRAVELVLDILADALPRQAALSRKVT